MKLNIHKHDLNANIKISESGQLVIMNNDKFNWINVELTVNDEYKAKIYQINAGTTKKVGLVQFQKEDGTIFSSFYDLVKTISVSCKTSHGKYGFYEIK
jgi:hypothetical protein